MEMCTPILVGHTVHEYRFTKELKHTHTVQTHIKYR